MPARERGKALAAWLLVLLAAGCQDSVATKAGVKGTDAFRRYVAIGTSLSMGTMSDGITYASQKDAWPSLLAAQAFAAEFTQPLLKVPGCRVPLIAPLQLTRRLSGASAVTGDTTCAGLIPGATAPFQDVAIDGATAFSAMTWAPESAVAGTDRQARQLYPLVLRPGRTQVTAMRAERPSLVTVELGANEVLHTTSGLVLPATGYEFLDVTGTYIPADTFAAWYDRVIDSVKATRAPALLVGAINVTSIPSLRRGGEIFGSVLDSLTFDSFYLTMSADCRTTAANNLIFVPQKVLAAVAAAQAAVAAAQPRPVFSCADVPGTQDFVLTPADTAAVAAVVRTMDAHIRQVAAANGFAYLDADAVLQEILVSRPPFSLVDLLSCVLPYGAYMSIDGVHPNSYGQRMLANAAAQALDQRYGFRIPARPVPVLTRTQLCS